MSVIQKILTSVLPSGTVARMKAETDQWQLRCTGCDSTLSLWAAGGIRYGKCSKSSFSATWVRCRRCSGLRFAVVERVADSGEAGRMTEVSGR